MLLLVIYSDQLHFQVSLSSSAERESTCFKLREKVVITQSVRAFRLFPFRVSSYCILQMTFPSFQFLWYMTTGTSLLPPLLLYHPYFLSIPHCSSRNSFPGCFMGSTVKKPVLESSVVLLRIKYGINIVWNPTPSLFWASLPYQVGVQSDGSWVWFFSPAVQDIAHL